MKTAVVVMLVVSTLTSKVFAVAEEFSLPTHEEIKNLDWTADISFRGDIRRWQKPKDSDPSVLKMHTELRVEGLPFIGVVQEIENKKFLSLSSYPLKKKICLSFEEKLKKIYGPPTIDLKRRISSHKNKEFSKSWELQNSKVTAACEPQEESLNYVVAIIYSSSEKAKAIDLECDLIDLSLDGAPQHKGVDRKKRFKIYTEEKSLTDHQNNILGRTKEFSETQITVEAQLKGGKDNRLIIKIDRITGKLIFTVKANGQTLIGNYQCKRQKIIPNF